MTDVRMPAFAGESISSPAKARTARRTGFFHRLIGALHFSRRLQAESVLRRYRHLRDNRREQAVTEFTNRRNLTDED
jgi:hypothetical protein